MSSIKGLFRATYTQAIIIGLLSFICPGIFSAIQSLGAGGLKTPTTANAAYALNAGILCLSAPLWAVFANRFGLRLTLFFGTIGFCIYSAGLYTNSKTGNQWFVMFSSIFSGLSGGAFWTSEAAIAISYPEEKNRGVFIATWQFINKFGTIIAGAISLSLNAKGSTSGSVSLNTYVVLFSIQTIGPFVSFLLSPPEKIIRKDGSKVRSNITDQKVSDRFKDIWRVFTRKEILYLSPGFLGCVWIGTWQSNYTAAYFSVRARSLYSFVTAIICMITDFTMGALLDMKFKRSTKVKASWAVIASLITGYYVFGFTMQSIFDKNDQTALDWNDPGFARAYIPFLFCRIGTEAMYNWFYYYLGSIPLTTAEVTIAAGIVRCCESFGQCMAYAVGATNKSNMVNLGVSAGIFFACIPFVTYATFLTNDDPIETFNASEEDDEEGLVETEKIPIEKLEAKLSNTIYSVRSTTA